MIVANSRKTTTHEGCETNYFVLLHFQKLSHRVEHIGWKAARKRLSVAPMPRAGRNDQKDLVGAGRSLEASQSTSGAMKIKRRVRYKDRISQRIISLDYRGQRYWLPPKYITCTVSTRPKAPYSHVCTPLSAVRE